jgi:hypothetical protein
VVELNRLELEFLFRLDFRLTVTISVFESYCSYFEKEVMACEKKPERSLPVFGSSASTSPVEKSKSSGLWSKSSPARQRVPLDQEELQAEYRRTFARIGARESPPGY